MPEKSAMSVEDQLLRMKFRSLTYTAASRQQKQREVDPEAQTAFKDKSYQMWRRLNPGYEEPDYVTSTREAQEYEEGDFAPSDKRSFRVRDRHTEFVEYVVRDKALARQAPRTTN